MGDPSRSRSNNWLPRLRLARVEWELAYRRFARARGFRSFNDWPYHRRGFLECWLEPGFRVDRLLR